MDPLQTGALTLCAGKAGIAAGTTTTLTSANAIDYSINGKAYTKAAVSNEATPTTDDVTGAGFKAITAGKGSVFVVMRNADGDLKVAQGSIEALDAAGNFVTAPQFAPVPANRCPFGYIVVKVKTGGAAWTFGSSNLAGPPANTVITFVDIFTLPDRVQVK